MFVLRPRRNILGAQLSVDCRPRHNLSLYKSATYRHCAIQVWKKKFVCICGDKITLVCSDCGWLGRPAGPGCLSGSSTNFCYSKILLTTFI